MRGFLLQNVKIKIPEREDFSKFLPFLLKYSRAGKNLTKLSALYTLAVLEKPLNFKHFQ